MAVTPLWFRFGGTHFAGLFVFPNSDQALMKMRSVYIMGMDELILKKIIGLDDDHTRKGSRNE